jgi:hypothetical protein
LRAFHSDQSSDAWGAGSMGLGRARVNGCVGGLVGTGRAREGGSARGTHGRFGGLVRSVVR